MTFILGLTGSIGTGKSTVSRMLKRLKIPIHDADKEVYNIYEHDASFLKAFMSEYPGYVKINTIDRRKVAEEAFQNSEMIAWLQKQLHPRVQKRAYAFMEDHLKKQTPLIILDIPLLFENGYESFCHGIAVTLCPPELQQQRVLARPNMNLEKLQKILAKQWPQEKKQEKATWVIHTDKKPSDVFQHIRHLLLTCQTFVRESLHDHRPNLK